MLKLKAMINFTAVGDSTSSVCGLHACSERRGRGGEGRREREEKRKKNSFHYHMISLIENKITVCRESMQYKLKLKSKKDKVQYIINVINDGVLKMMMIILR